jgi:hypothetical protein
VICGACDDEEVMLSYYGEVNMRMGRNIMGFRRVRFVVHVVLREIFVGKILKLTGE